MPIITKSNAIAELPCQWGAVGAGTKDILNQHGVFDVTYPLEGVGTQALLDSLKYCELKDKKCAVFKGNSGNEQLEAGLREAGAKVTEIVCYQRVRSQDNPQPLAHAITEQKIDLIIMTSGDALKALHAMLPENSIALLNEIPLLVISERIEKIAQTLGFQRIILARDASDEAIVASISNWVKTRSDNDGQNGRKEKPT
jgi:uroporphyrinogen-III synthase